MKKIILLGIAVLLAVIAATVFLVFKNLDTIVKSVIEKAGTHVAGTKVSVGNVDLSLSTGEATINKLKIANPSGFSGKPMVFCDKINAQVNYKDAAIKKIIIDNPVFNFEAKGLDSNFQQVQKHIKSLSKEKTEEPKTAPKGKEETVLQIDLLKITNSKVSFTSDKLKTARQLDIKSIELTQLKGTPAQIGIQIMGQIVSEIIQEVAGKMVKGKLTEKLGQGADKSKLEGLFKK